MQSQSFLSGTQLIVGSVLVLCTMLVACDRASPPPPPPSVDTTSPSTAPTPSPTATPPAPSLLPPSGGTGVTGETGNTGNMGNMGNTGNTPTTPPASLPAKPNEGGESNSFLRHDIDPKFAALGTAHSAVGGRAVPARAPRLMPAMLYVALNDKGSSAGTDSGAAARPRDDAATDPTLRPDEPRTPKQDAKRQAKKSLAGSDRNFIVHVGNDSQSAEQAALYVASKTLNHELRAYAAKMGDERGTANQKLRELALKYRIEVPPDPQGKLRDKLDHLRTLKGTEMEKYFLQVFGVQANLDSIAMFEREANHGDGDDLRDFASDNLPMLRNHYDRARALQHKYGFPRTDTLKM